MTTSQSNEPIQQEQSFPLISIVQLFTFSAALITCIDFRECGKRLADVQFMSQGDAWGTAIAGVAFSGFLIGAAIGLGQIRKWRGMMLSGSVGGVVSLLVMATYVAPASPGRAITAMFIPLVTTVILRFKTP